MNPDQQWLELKAEMLKRIDEIDKATPWRGAREPRWWLEMMEIASLLRGQK